MSAAFTPGPWGFKMVPDSAEERSGVYEYSGFYIGIPSDESDDVSTFLEGAFVEDGNMIANANLIAAAPTMARYIQRKAEAGDAEAQEIWEMACGRRS